MLICQLSITPSLATKSLPSLLPTTVSIAASNAMSRILSLTAPLNTIATAPSASSATAANLEGSTALETVRSTLTETVFLLSELLCGQNIRELPLNPFRAMHRYPRKVHPLRVWQLV